MALRRRSSTKSGIFINCKSKSDSPSDSNCHSTELGRDFQLGDLRHPPSVNLKKDSRPKQNRDNNSCKHDYGTYFSNKQNNNAKLSMQQLIFIKWFRNHRALGNGYHKALLFSWSLILLDAWFFYGVLLHSSASESSCHVTNGTCCSWKLQIYQITWMWLLDIM